MKNLKFLLLSVLFLSFASFAQDSDWKIYKSVDGVNVLTKIADCRPPDNMAQRVILIKLENTTDENLTIEWDLRVWYNGKEMLNRANPDQRHYSFSLEAKESMEGDCTMLENTKNLYLYKKFLNFEKSEELTKFLLENLKVVTK